MMSIKLENSSFEQMFELAPIAMWVEDFSGVKCLFDRWRSAGVTDIEAFLRADRSRVAACSRAIRVLQVNRKTLDLFEASDMEQLVSSIDQVFRDDMLESHINELVQLFQGQHSFSSNTVNYTLSGKRLDIQLRGQVLPGHEETLDRILLTTEDVSLREAAHRRERAQALYAQGLFEHSPVSLWVEDFSRIRNLLEDLRSRHIVDLRVFMDVHPDFVRQCLNEIKVIDVNQATLDMFRAADRQTLLQNQHAIFRDDVEEHFREQLIDLWEGRLFHSHEVMNYALDGSERYVLLHFSVLPGHEHDWSLVLVSLTDITARKKAEAYLEYLGRHDVLTKLYNRSYYTEEINRLERKKFRPIGVLIIDLNGLKEANDSLGHDAGDGLLRRLGEVLNEAVSAPHCAARIGGDEFAVLMPGAGENDVKVMVEQIDKLLDINNQFYADAPISVSVGVAICEMGETLESAVRRADLEMYHEKREYYASLPALDRRNRRR
ncbi:sensor domain-containing diguanylate cyclase [Martelella mediterranea]|uniref:Diguanylate cyclase DosC n=1 Tax=Martelella mediterranea DSM 17316 TaxID=1122214 RepID=A0A1U9Z413_9HYPH|nr:sensor domain-containing diguanylate cyclase [Martelella mediterranea]AQZ52439.1 Diguanylate cyclase DosC [Martelella mediterranea DSM 17316]